jgi:hypothetical protein
MIESESEKEDNVYSQLFQIKKKCERERSAHTHMQNILNNTHLISF